QRVVQALDGRDRLAVEDELVSHRLHAEDTDLLLDQPWQDLVLEAPEVRVHDVQGHLDGVEPEVVGGRHVEHPAVDRGVLVPGEADVPESSASSAPPGAKTRSGSSMRMTSWICMRSTRSVWRRRRDSSICSAAASRVRPSIFVIRKTLPR